MPEQRDDITAAMHDVQDQYHVVRHDAVDDDVIVGRKAAQARPQIFVTRRPMYDTGPATRNAR
jgi:hypothetical protein